MFLSSLYLYHFKSYEKQTYQFNKRIICFTGQNGVGKTNLLDAIYYLCLTKSYFNSVDQQLIKHQQVSFIVEGAFTVHNQLQKVKCLQARLQKKEFTVNEVRYEKLAQHIGLLPVVMVTPDDHILIYGGSEERRKFIDTTLSQIDRKYLEALQEYNKYLTQRNALLKQFAEQQYFDANLLLAYDIKLAPLNDFIFENRKAFIAAFTPVFNKVYAKLSSEKEQVTINYESSLHQQNGKQILLKNIDKDKIMKRTMEGIHRDDLLFEMNGEIVKKFGSQGQQKTFLFSLKLAQAFMLQDALEKKPFLLLDDIFDKLDAERSSNLLAYLYQNYEGQIFITDTQKTRLEMHFGDYINEVEIFELNN